MWLVCFALQSLRTTAPRTRLYVDGETAKNTVIGVWLFGGLVPPLVAVNVFAVNKLRAPPRYDGFVASKPGTPLPLASLGAPDVVTAEDVNTVLAKLRSVDDVGTFAPLAVAMGTATEGSGPAYITKPAFKRRLRGVSDATLDACFDAWSRGSGVAAKTTVASCLDRWRDGGIDAFQRDVFLGRLTVLAGFAGLLAIDASVLAAGLSIAAQ